MNLKKSRFYDYSVKEIESLGGVRKRLLLHACCGPCSCFPLLFLCPHFDVTIYYVNPNIYPEQEYKRRLEELIKLLGYLKRDYGYDVSLVIPPYEPEPYQEHMKPYEGMKEGSARCLECYRYRMERAYQYAEDHGFDYFTTVMTISRQKSSAALNAIGQELSAKHPKVKYLYSDFKHNKGIDIGREMRIHYGLYNQLYCGCRPSLLEAEERQRKASLESPVEKENLANKK